MFKKIQNWFMWHFQNKFLFNAGYQWAMSRLFKDSNEDQRLLVYLDKQNDDYFIQGARKAVMTWRTLRVENDKPAPKDSI